jgi:hypothetical protein
VVLVITGRRGLRTGKYSNMREDGKCFMETSWFALLGNYY